MQAQGQCTDKLRNESYPSSFKEPASPDEAHGREGVGHAMFEALADAARR